MMRSPWLRDQLPVLAVASTILLTSLPPASGEFVVVEPSSPAYHRYGVSAGTRAVVEPGAVAGGGVRSNGDVVVKAGGRVTGDAEASGEVDRRGTVDGTVSEGVEPLALPALPPPDDLRTLADRFYEGSQVIRDAVRVDDVVFVDGNVHFQGPVDGQGTVIVVGNVFFDGDAQAAEDTFLSVVAYGDVRLAAGRSLAAVLRAGHDVELELGSRLEGVIVADRVAHLKKDSTLVVRPPDQDPPSLELVSPAPDVWVASPRPEVVARALDPGTGVDPASVYLLVDGADAGGELSVAPPLSEATVTWTPAADLADGTHAFELTVADRAGNAATLSFELHVDATPPEVVLLEPSRERIPVYGSRIRPVIRAGISDLLSGVAPETVTVVWDGLDVTLLCDLEDDGVRCPLQTESLGSHSLEVRAADLAGNPGQAALDFEYVRDDQAPRLTVERPGNLEVFNTPRIEVEGTATDDFAVVSLRLEGQEVPLNGDRFQAELELREGTHGVTVDAEDEVGHRDSVTLFLTLDTVPPEVVVTTPQGAPGGVTVVNTDRLTIRGEASDDQELLSVRVAGAEPDQVEEVYGTLRFVTEVEVPPGTTSLPVEAVDVAGNSTTVTVVVRRLEPPRIDVESPVDGAFVDGTRVDVAGTVSAGVTAVTVNGLPATVAGGRFELAGLPLASGVTIVDAVATDADGLRVVDKVRVLRDVAPPRVVIHAPSDGDRTTTAAVDVRGLVSDLGGAADGLRVTVQGVEAQVASGSFLAAGIPLAPGPKTLRVTAEDAGGHVSHAEVTVVHEPPSGPRVEIVGGHLQRAMAGSDLPSPLVVRVVDGDGRPLAGADVLMRVAEGNGKLDGDRRLLALVTDSDGVARSGFRLGSRVGEGVHRVEASRPGAVSAVFLASADPGPANGLFLDQGDQQVGAAGRRLPDPLVVTVTDAGFNRLAEVPVTFRVVRGDGTFTDGSRERVVMTDARGEAAVDLVLEASEGRSNNVVEAVLEGVPERPSVAFTASGLAAGPPEETSLSGVVLDNTGLPVPGVTARIAGTPLTATTDGAGTFHLAEVPVGTVLLEIDGRTTSREGDWPHLEFELTTVAGRDNGVGMPIYLLPLDPRGLAVTAETGGVLELPELPGFSLEVAPGSVTFPGGGREGVVSVTLVHADRVPMTPNFGQQPRFVVTLQPAGATFDPPARLSLPNVDGLEPGQVTEMYSFDHDLGRFVSIGPAAVSADGQSVRSLEGVGVVKSGWHCGGDPQVTGTSHDCPACEICDGSQCVPGCQNPFFTLPAGLGQDSLFDQGSKMMHMNCDDCKDDDDCTVNERCAEPGSGARCLFEYREITELVVTVNGHRAVHGGEVELFADVRTGRLPVTFDVVPEHENCDRFKYRWVIREGGEELEVHEREFTLTLPDEVRDTEYNIRVEVECHECDREVLIFKLIIRETCLEVEFDENEDIEINPNYRFSEDAKIGLKVVSRSSGKVNVDFDKSADVREVTEVDPRDPLVYARNKELGALLPAVVEFKQGEVTLLARSLAYTTPFEVSVPKAMIKIDDFRLCEEETIEISQWVDARQDIHELSSNPTGFGYDWLESRIKYIFDQIEQGNGAVSKMFERVRSYHFERLGTGVGGETPVNREPASEISLNPFIPNVRVNHDSGCGNQCGQPCHVLFTNILIHEARHAYQNSILLEPLGADDDANPATPPNDDDLDFLPDTLDVKPTDIDVDKDVSRSVCITSCPGESLVLPAVYGGDARWDPLSKICDPSSRPNVRWAREMDAHTFGSDHDELRDPKP